METRLQTGTIWSGILHAGAVFWVLLGDWLYAPDAPIQLPSMSVSTISAAEFDAMQSSAPKASDTPAEQPAAAPAEEPAQPEAPAMEESPAPPARPEAAPQPEPEPQPEPAPEPAPEPVATPPEPAPLPEPEPDPVPQPEPVPEDVVVLPEEQPIPSMSSSLRPKPKPADRVAPAPVSVPEEAVTAETPEQAVTEAPAETPQPPQEAREETVAEETGDVLRTEATEEQDEALGMTASVRPKARPSRPARPSAPAETPAAPAASSSASASDNSDSDADAIAAAVAAAAAESAAEPAPAASSSAGQGGSGNSSGPPLNAGEIGDIKSAIGNKWNLGSASSEVMRTTVIVRVEFTPDGKPGNISLVQSDGPSQQATDVAFAAARRAIQRAYVEGGIPLPADKYETWKVLEFVFDANGMRMR